mmetsp:Transcript_17590/g.29542  ORF Transcript_17590/g.29542 Transcript_17590/m.29542 type:complete len:223 (-) Transcript_17590:424-1092(-)|eukprot:CAMPEP_0198210824 /NCGR_PEP_ID=MMETSP1445-20131203/22466_1 /TAXON_ID=36898 /ORGANISM="Pyramimonas sp., Strain CCMP2087" /LENGTH=222 /DNA_ID=CAMNT_0043884979 /DNA_START=249 /DNA_END=920 /DNA_ORIENTATION=-
MVKAISRRRCLYLHGKGDTGLSFLQTLRPLQNEWAFLDLPEIEVIAPSAPHPVPEGGGYAWWQTAEGERSHTAKEFVGLEATLNLLRAEVRASGPFDYVVGHSQGAMLAAILLAGRTGPPCDDSPNHVWILQPHARAILSGAGWPAPFGEKLEALTPDDVPRSLHCIGTLDTVSPPELGLKLAACLGGEVMEHDGGNVFPLTNKKVLWKMAEFFIADMKIVK